nr:SDR family NAD(P)-dependent oxidoreductase [Pseudomonadota bacterium]
MDVKDMANPVAVVFGGSGFIGRHVVRHLARAGMTVRVPTRNPSAATFLRVNGHVGQIVPLRCDLRDETQVAAAVHGAQVVINLIGILYESRRGDFQRIHVD